MCFDQCVPLKNTLVESSFRPICFSGQCVSYAKNHLRAKTMILCFFFQTKMDQIKGEATRKLGIQFLDQSICQPGFFCCKPISKNSSSWMLRSHSNKEIQVQFFPLLNNSTAAAQAQQLKASYQLVLSCVRVGGPQIVLTHYSSQAYSNLFQHILI